MAVAMAVLALAVLAVAASASAQGTDIVRLPNGGRLRGTVEVYEPGHRVVILLPDGSRRTLAAGEFDSVQFADAPAPAPPPPEPVPEPVPAAPPAAPAIALPPESPPPAPSAEPTPPPVEAVPPSSTPDAAVGGGDMQRLESAMGVPATAASAAVFGDGGGADLPWNGTDPRTRSLYAPEGMLHVVVEARGALAVNLGEDYGRGLVGAGELAGGVDLRIPETVLHVRGALVLGLQSHRASTYPTYGGQLHMDATGFGYLALRALAGVDATSWLALRAGGEYGIEVLPVFDVVRVYGGPELDVVFRALDDRRIEIGLSLAIQDRSHAIVELSGGSEIRNVAGTAWSPRVAIVLAGVFL